MMFLVQILPIALVLLIFTLFWRRREQQLKPKKQRIFTGKLLRTRLIYIIYSGVLLVAMAAYYILPVSADDTNAMSEAEPSDYYFDLYGPAQQNRFDDIAPEFLVEQKQYDFSMDRLIIPAPGYGSSYGDVLIAVTKDEEVDREILIDIYETPVVLNGYDITETIKRAEVSIAAGTVNVENSFHTNRLQFNQFNPPVAAQQFMKGERADLASGLNYSSGMSVIHLRVPAHIEIQSDPEAEVIEFKAQ
ncbi:hypothetical protein [Jeotgalibacillus haloalkalitolerans]|uniref:Uncharacterized protein n=1 Tax=Jeotgalibacillus haloalkalitolerans TaxID=3104292 RepID=A0ABU5KPT4_9BACL|nr:hypothetical protein [Jeotgalibacillus sp. HH7-29]MDZ5713257.1 hypothetical protein [Jeotgalibacillus sp. HH7-29]